MLFSCVFNLIHTLSYYPAYKSCKNCKWFIPNKNEKSPFDYGLCKLFINKTNINDINLMIYEYAKHCRSNEYLCGISGVMYEPITIVKDEKQYETERNEITELIDEYEELTNRCCGEVNETHEIEEIEQDFLKLFLRVKKILVRNNLL
jgi:hypothetical protein